MDSMTHHGCSFTQIQEMFPMRLLVLSDLHREWWSDEEWAPFAHGPRFEIDLAASKPDVVVLAGDIDEGTQGIEWASQTFSGLPVIYVHGNHEGYGHALDTVQGNLIRIARESGHIHYLQCGEQVIGGARFLGVPLWTDFCLNSDAMQGSVMARAERGMNDYNSIRLESESRMLHPNDTVKFHRQQVAWLAEKLAEPFVGKTVVVTHMAPSAHSLPPSKSDKWYAPAYASHLDHLVEQADFWIHGHIHSSVDYRIGKCRVVSNPCGLPGQIDINTVVPKNADYNPNFIIEI